MRRYGSEHGRHTRKSRHLRSDLERPARAGRGAWPQREPALASFVHATILKHDRLENALSYHLAKKIGGEDLSPMMTREIFEEAMAADPSIGEAVRADLSAVFERDPACHSHLEAFLFYKGFHALRDATASPTGCGPRTATPWRCSSRAASRSCSPSTSIRPPSIGNGIMIDHATGVVIGETAVVEDDVSMLHGVTLGGTGKETGDRHPKIRRGVLLSMGAKILGNIEIGEYSRVGAGSVVLKSGSAGLHRRRRARASDQLRRRGPPVAGDEPVHRRRHGLQDLNRLQAQSVENFRASSAAVTIGLRSSAPPGNFCAGTRASMSKRSVLPSTASASALPPKRRQRNAMARIAVCEQDARPSVPKCGMRVRVMPTVPLQRIFDGRALQRGKDLQHARADQTRRCRAGGVPVSSRDRRTASGQSALLR